jgi:DNA mismatch endonuclease (patch repair protein)
MHTCPRGCRIPAANRNYWLAKLRRNKSRDARTRRSLQKLGYQSLKIWECQTRRPESLIARLKVFLESR